MLLTKDTLERYVKEGWLISQRHPTLPLTIYNYSQATQYEAKWDEVTLACRGLVLDDNGKIVARPFKKFFNIEECKHTPTDSFEVYEKMDGSLGILFYYEGNWIFASRGSFTSEQALKFKQIFTDKYQTSHLTMTNTYLFEIIYPTNRIVVDYGEMEDVVMLGEIHTASGEELDLDHYANSIFNVVKKHHFTNYQTIQSLNWQNHEGFIVKFSNGDRCKIKFADYVKLHRIITNCSSYDIWQNLMTFDRLPEEFLKDVPDEFYQWVKGTEEGLRHAFNSQLNLHTAVMSSILRDGTLDRKELAARVLETKDVNHGIVFGLIDGKDVTEKLWKLVKPAYQKPFGETNPIEIV
jgi:hypothetical protein